VKITDKMGKIIGIIVNYNVHEQTHEGYCSDPSECNSQDYEQTVNYPLWKGITNNDIDKTGKVITDMKV
jgi:hypothetical protein